MTEDPLPRRTVREFCKHYGIGRPAYLEARLKAKVNARDWDTPLSGEVQRRLLRHISVGRRADHFRREAERRSASTPRRPVTVTPPPRPALDVDAEIERVSSSLSKWRSALVELTREHLVSDEDGRCAKCRRPGPCRVRSTLTSLDAGLVEEIALWDVYGGDPSSDDRYERLRLLHAARGRWQQTLVRYTVGHMLEGRDGRCPTCGTAAPCETKRTLTRLNKGIARLIENEYAILDDDELDAAFRRRPTTGGAAAGGWG